MRAAAVACSHWRLDLFGGMADGPEIDPRSMLPGAQFIKGSLGHVLDVLIIVVVRGSTFTLPHP
jgi:hypothetical protein